MREPQDAAAVGHDLDGHAFAHSAKTIERMVGDEIEIPGDGLVRALLQRLFSVTAMKRSSGVVDARGLSVFVPAMKWARGVCVVPARKASRGCKTRGHGAQDAPLPPYNSTGDVRTWHTAAQSSCGSCPQPA